ncbi:glycosyltransferase [Sediminibacter sp. Hel_I_10]|uniref:glycosyltransferase n=1 Tax=Sediminibacter sp. Hel_I_10 TaxID=1392490 RepID=UPI00068C27AF|nr:glycosyltransferase [Sediminibacter sp. Hel_I_10]
MITYNHEDYIYESVISILNQQVSFSYNLIIANDCSPDNTDKIIDDIKASHDKGYLINYYSHAKNIGVHANFEFALNKCKGQYVAVCEGDDYWIDNLKLQKQVDFLNKNPNYNLITGYARQYFQNDNLFKDPLVYEKLSFDFRDMIYQNHCSTCSTMFRNIFNDTEPFKLLKNLGADRQLWIRVLGKNAKGMKMDEINVVYRRHDSSLTGKRRALNPNFLEKIGYIKSKIRKANYWNDYFDGEATASVISLKSKLYKKIVRLSKDEKQWSYFILYVFKFYISKVLIQYNNIIHSK